MWIQNESKGYLEVSAQGKTFLDVNFKSFEHQNI